MEPVNANTPNQSKRRWWNILMVLLKTIAYLFVIGCSMMGGLALVASFLPDTSMASMTASDFYDWQNLNLLYLGFAIGVVLSTIAFRYFVDDQNYRSIGLGLNRLGTPSLLGMAWAIGLLSLSFGLVWSFGGVQILDTTQLGMASLGYLSFFLLVAIVEEVVFRGYLLQMVTDHFNYQLGIAISGIGFAIIHLGNDYFTWIAFCNLALGGILMSLLYLKYRSLYAPIAFHWIWNYFQGNILGFDVSGNSVLGLLEIEVGSPNWLSGGNFGLEGSLITCTLLFLSIVYIWNTSKTQFAASEWEKTMEPAIT